MDAAGFEGGADDERGAGGGEGPGEEALGLAGGDAEEVVEGGASGDGEGGEPVLLQEHAGAVGAVLASTLWFSGLGFGARFAAPLLTTARAWQVLDLLIAATMLAIAAKLAF